jgi:protein-S-isoprenylcysteine O-methyltransferase Ste14
MVGARGSLKAVGRSLQRGDKGTFKFKACEVQMMTSAKVPSEARRASSFMQTLYIPWVDKTIAVAAVLPSVFELYHRYHSADLTFPRAVLGLQVLLLIITMIIRRTPVRVTPNPWFWLLAFVATYGILAFTAFAPNGAPLAPSVVPNVLAFVSAAIIIYARLSLGRSIGFVPANRGIITTGAYRFVRHPIYTGAFLGLLSFVLRSYTPLNLLMAATIVALFMIKSVVEERFLRDDPEYAAYLQRVRWRWIPRVA